jgi:spermidine synthase
LETAVQIEFEELDYRATPIGNVSVRRRTEVRLGVTVYEIKLDDEFLMSSLFTASEVALARLGLAELDGDDLNVAVGGLGLGYTAATVLEHANVGSLHVIEYLSPVIDWHERGLLPLGESLTSDPRCQFVQGDFFKLACSSEGLLPESPNSKFDAILVDIDHSPRHVLSPAHAAFYSRDGLIAMARHIVPGGVFALWSDDPPDDTFIESLADVFATVVPHVVSFPNPYLDRDSACTVYVARKSR